MSSSAWRALKPHGSCEAITHRSHAQGVRTYPMNDLLLSATESGLVKAYVGDHSEVEVDDWRQM